jgi:hypothetical protein
MEVTCSSETSFDIQPINRCEKPKITNVEERFVTGRVRARKRRGVCGQLSWGVSCKEQVTNSVCGYTVLCVFGSGTEIRVSGCVCFVPSVCVCACACVRVLCVWVDWDSRERLRRSQCVCVCVCVWAARRNSQCTSEGCQELWGTVAYCFSVSSCVCVFRLILKIKKEGLFRLGQFLTHGKLSWRRD